LAAAIQSDRVFEALRSEILACRMPPAAKIKIPLVCTRFQSSPGAVREALSRLMSEGLVRNTPQKGFSVSPVSLKELFDLTEARIAIECICLERAFASGGIEWETQIVAAFHRLGRVSPKLDDWPSDLNPAWSLARGQVMRQDCVKNRLPLTRADERDVTAEHQAIFDAILAHDLATCQRLMGEHFQRTADLLAASPVIRDPGRAPERATG
jgi:GntR family carbon starvation induced transcriptional regulator